jgi:hypothetical protein
VRSESQSECVVRNFPIGDPVLADLARYQADEAQRDREESALEEIFIQAKARIKEDGQLIDQALTEWTYNDHERQKMYWNALMTYTATGNSAALSLCIKGAIFDAALKEANNLLKQSYGDFA